MLINWTKEQVRRWLHRRAKDPQPLPDQREIRRQLGRELVDAARRDQKRGK